MASLSASRLPLVAPRGSRTDSPGRERPRSGINPKPIGFRHNARASEMGRLWGYPRINEFRDRFKYSDLSQSTFHSKTEPVSIDRAYLPEELGELHALEILNFPDNILSGLPKSISNLRRLQHLSLRSNNIRSLSATFR